MHSINRPKCRLLFGYVHSTTAGQKPYKAITEGCQENKRFLVDFIGIFKQTLEQGRLSKRQAVEGLELLHDQATDAYDALVAQVQDSQDNLLARIALRNQLTDLLCELLTIETEDELLALQQQVLKENHNHLITSNISYLDMDHA
jgi:hypothetical protein